MDRKYNWYEVGIININLKKFNVINDAKKKEKQEKEIEYTENISLCVWLR